MKDREIIEKAIIKASQLDGSFSCELENIDRLTGLEINCLIFSHEFAKAFFGEENSRTWLYEYESWELPNGRLTENYIEQTIPSWKYHLQKMVLEEEPLKYLEKFLND